MTKASRLYNKARESLAAFGLGIAVLALGGCPADDTGGGGETGGTGGAPPAESMDPFESTTPPRTPSETVPWPSPTLGNGLVYDTRFDVGEQSNTYSIDVTGVDLTAGVDWATFVTPYADKQDVGFRQTAVDADVWLASGPTGDIILNLVDRSSYMADDASNYKHETRTYVFHSAAEEQATLQISGAAQPGDPRPIAIDTLAAAGDPVATVAWVYDNNPVPWTMVVGQDSGTFQATVDTLANNGYRPISVASRNRNGTSEYSAILVNDGIPSSDWKLHIGLDWSNIQNAAEATWTEGFYPLRGNYEDGSEQLPKFNVLWARQVPQQDVQVRYNLDDVLFEMEDKDWRSQGYYLENAAMYKDAGDTRYAGVWVKEEPYFRYEIADSFAYENDPDPNFTALYQPFQDLVKYHMTLDQDPMMQDPKEGEYFRPSATLHIWQGPNLVVNRAYTFAPAHYPDTRINAPFGIASASKAITAAAVVKILGQNNIPLTAAFDVTAGLATDWPSGAPTVAKVLGNVGGFAAGRPYPYADHEEIAAAGWGGATLPIDEQEYVDYVVGEGLLSGQPGFHWNSMSVDMWAYSNPGYSMLAQLVREQSGMPYEDYVTSALLAPVNLDDRIFAERANRNTVDPALVSGDEPLGTFQPLRSGLRKYLVNTSHPYACTDNPPCGFWDAMYGPF